MVLERRDLQFNVGDEPRRRTGLLHFHKILSLAERNAHRYNGDGDQNPPSEILVSEYHSPGFKTYFLSYTQQRVRNFALICAFLNYLFIFYLGWKLTSVDELVFVSRYAHTLTPNNSLPSCCFLLRDISNIVLVVVVIQTQLAV